MGHNSGCFMILHLSVRYKEGFRVTDLEQSGWVSVTMETFFLIPALLCDCREGTGLL